MATPGGTGARSQFSPDGLWWWDGAQWRRAVSADGRWRWNGQGWEALAPQAPARRSGSTTTAVMLSVAIFGGVLVLLALFTELVLYTMGNQISNVFSNVAAALGSSPSP